LSRVLETFRKKKTLLEAKEIWVLALFWAMHFLNQDGNVVSYAYWKLKKNEQDYILLMI
jgi:hypothetical protein